MEKKGFNVLIVVIFFVFWLFVLVLIFTVPKAEKAGYSGEFGVSKGSELGVSKGKEIKGICDNPDDGKECDGVEYFKECIPGPGICVPKTDKSLGACYCEA